jgi:glycosyltransferase involved in cell wall biosynthesis
MSGKVSCCLIVKNEPLLEMALLSIKKFVDEIVVVDTGSTDGTTQEVARRYADIFEVYLAANNPETGLIEDFSQARNRSFELATEENWILWMDSDDVIAGADKLHNIINSYDIKSMGVDAVGILFPYEYSYDHTGAVTCRHYRERLFSDKNFFSFINPVHEVVVPKANAKVSLLPREELIFKHQRQYSAKPQEPGRNLRILRRHFESNPNDARQMYYLGLETCNAGLTDEAIQLLSKYIDISGWDDERACAALKLVDIYQSRGDYKNGLVWAFKTVEIQENWGEGYFALARMFYFIAMQGGPQEFRNWARCAHFAKMGLALPETKTLLFVNPVDRDVEIHKYLNMALNKLGDVKGALSSVDTGLKSNPTEATLYGNKKLYEAFLARQDAVAACNRLKSVDALDTKSVDMISALLNNLSIESNTSPKETALSSITSLKESGELSEFSADILISLINKTLDPDKFLSQVFQPNKTFLRTDDKRPIANISADRDGWNIPETYDINGDNMHKFPKPLLLSREQLQATVLMIWKQYMFRNEILSAILFLENAPYEVRDLFATKMALSLTKRHIINIKTSYMTRNHIDLVIDKSLSDTKAAKQLQDNVALMKLTAWSVAEYFEKNGHKIKNCFMQDDNSIFVEGY